MSHITNDDVFRKYKRLTLLENEKEYDRFRNVTLYYQVNEGPLSKN